MNQTSWSANTFAWRPSIIVCASDWSWCLPQHSEPQPSDSSLEKFMFFHYKYLEESSPGFARRNHTCECIYTPGAKYSTFLSSNCNYTVFAFVVAPISLVLSNLLNTQQLRQVLLKGVWPTRFFITLDISLPPLIEVVAIPQLESNPQAPIQIWSDRSELKVKLALYTGVIPLNNF